MELKDRINGYRDDICDTLSEVIKIPSVAGEPEPGMPYGEETAKALKYILDTAGKMGFRVKNCGNRAGHAEYGEGDEYAAVLVHLDVVPAGGGWVYPPFGGVIEAGKIYGRGACDNKGPAVAALYCLKALKDAKIRGKRRIRVIFGCDEERGMGDIPFYFESEPLPVMAFTPDAEYPIYNREKGLLHMDVDLKGLGADSPLRFIEGGLAPNVVPDKCVAAIKKGVVSLENVEKAISEYGSDRISAEELENGGIGVTSTGATAHASRAHLGFNACLNLAKFLCFLLGENAPAALKYADACVGLGTDGEGFGIKSQDDSGALTINIGILKADEAGGLMTIDIRYPVSEDGDKIIGIIQKKSAEYRCSASVDMHKVPLNIPETAPLIQKLSRAYERATGRKAEAKAQGGATYARTLENRGVAFGAGFDGGKSGGVHEANECMVIDELMRHCEICVEAMKELME